LRSPLESSDLRVLKALQLGRIPVCENCRLSDRRPAFLAINGITLHRAARRAVWERTIKRLLVEHQRGKFASLADFHCRVRPPADELEAMIRAGGFNEFGQTRTRQFWEGQRLAQSKMNSRNLEF
jgi:DNA polymerase III alpha subunit